MVVIKGDAENSEVFSLKACTLVLGSRVWLSMPIMPALGSPRQESQCKTGKLGLYNKVVNLRIAWASLISCLERYGGKKD